MISAKCWETFLQKLHDTLVKDLDSSFLGPDLEDDEQTLFGGPQPTENVEKEKRFIDNIEYLRDKLLPWLRARLQHSLVFQTFAAALGIDQSVSKTLTEQVLDSTVTPPIPGQRAIMDFLDLDAIETFLVSVKENGGPQAFDVQSYQKPPVLTFVRVFKAAQVAKAFEMTEAELTYLSKYGSTFGNFNLNQIPLELTQSDTLPKQLFLAWIALEQFFSLRNGMPKSERTLVDYLTDMKVVPSLPGGKTLDTLVEATGWEEKQIKALEAANFKRDTVADLQALQRAVRLLKRVGASATQLSTWAKDEPDHAEAEEVIETVKSCYDRERWLEVARGLNDSLRELQRRALVDFLTARMTRPHLAVGKKASPLIPDSIRKEAIRELQRKLSVLSYLQSAPISAFVDINGDFDDKTELAVKSFQQINDLKVTGVADSSTWAALDRAVGDMFDKNSLLEHFLIDIEISSCMLTSRIKQAISSVQMFVQRCLLNLESEVNPDDIDADQWKWVKNYRVWEANRKVFLYPENWIEPELRDDKTPFFKDLETELLQNDLTDDTVEKALINYLYKLDEVARLDIRGFCKEEKEEDSEEKEIYHVFGRTWNPPFVYYYRCGTFKKNAGEGEWTPWERVDLDIQGDHLMPVVYKQRLYLFWSIFEEKPNESQPQDGEPKIHSEIKLAWSVLKNDRWSSKQITSSVLISDNILDWSYYFTININDQLGVQADLPMLYMPEWHDDDSMKGAEVGSFTLLGCANGMLIEPNSGEIYASRPRRSVLGHQRFGVHSGWITGLWLKLNSATVIEVLKKVPFGYEVLPEPKRANGLDTFFFQDGLELGGNNSYFARPVLEKVTIPQNEIGTGSDSTRTIKKAAEINMRVGWTKPSPDPIAELAGIVTSGIYLKKQIN
jgi:hypothetical protein